jgi:hypothetical protein
MKQDRIPVNFDRQSEPSNLVTQEVIYEKENRSQR